MTTELLVGTKKGLFVLRGDASAGEPFEIATRAFPGDVVEFAIRDPRTGRYFASHTSGFYGPRLMYTDDPAGEWKLAEGPVFPEGGDATLERIWMIKPGEEDGLLYAGVAPAALFDLDRQRRVVVAQRAPLEGAQGRRLAARRRRSRAALDLSVAGRPPATGGRSERGRRLDHRRRR